MNLHQIGWLRLTAGSHPFLLWKKVWETGCWMANFRTSGIVRLICLVRFAC